MNTDIDEFDDFWNMTPRLRPGWKWVEGVVDTNEDHIKLWYGNLPTGNKKEVVRQGGSPVALVARGSGKSFRVQFLLSARSSDKRTAKILNAVRRELDRYLLEVHGPDDFTPWAYAQYHCYTAANIYSKVHWGWYPKGPKRPTEPHSSRVIRRGGRKFVFNPTQPSP